MSSTAPINLVCREDPPPPISMYSAGRRSSASPTRRRVMVIADPSRESSDALHWTLTHAILEEDELILLHLETPSSSRRGGALSAFLRRPASLGSAGSQQHLRQLALSSTSTSSSSSSSSSVGSTVSAVSGVAGEYEFLEVMRAACVAELPRLRVQVKKVEIEGREKAATILAQTKILRVDLLVIGQRRSFFSFRGCRMGGGMSGKGLDTAEFLIEHCDCVCVGVQKRARNCGYILNTKTHKNFWLLG